MADRAVLSFFGGREQPAAAPVVREADAADDAEDLLRPRARASASRLSATKAAPSAGTRPSALAWNGRLWPGGSWRRAREADVDEEVVAVVPAPASIVSAGPSWSQSHASLIA